MKEKVLQLYDQKYNCCQAVVCAYGEKYGLTHEQCFKITATFGGGIGKSTKYLCGSINGALIVLGLAIDDKQALLLKTREFLSKLESNHKSLNCLELLSEEKNSTMHSNKCRNILSEVCDALDSALS